MADVHHLGFTDGELQHNDQTITAVALLIRQIRPDVVLAHDPWRRYLLHPDHRAAGLVAVDAVYRAGEPRFTQPEAQRQLRFWKPDELWRFAPEEANHSERVSADCVEAKIAALLEHRSQYLTSFDIDPERGRKAEQFAERVRGRLSADPASGELAEPFRRIDLRARP